MKEETPRLPAGRRIWIQNYTTNVTAEGNIMKISFLVSGDGMKPKDFDGIFRAIENLCDNLNQETPTSRV